MEPTETSGLHLSLALDLLSDRWTVEMVGLLKGGPCLKSRLQDRLRDASSMEISLTLRRMERDGLIERHGDEGADEAEYRLTDLGRTLVRPLETLRDWVDEHFAAVVRTGKDAAPGLRP